MRKFALVGTLIAVCGLASTGCTLNSLGANIWKGFGYGIGAIPTGLIANALSTALGIDFSQNN